MRDFSQEERKKIKDQKSVTHEREKKLDAVLLLEKSRPQKWRGSVVLATLQHLPLTPGTTVTDHTPQNKNICYQILALFWQHYGGVTQQGTNNQRRKKRPRLITYKQMEDTSSIKEECI